MLGNTNSIMEVRVGSSDELTGRVTHLEGEVETLKLKIDTNIKANPFSVTFGTIDDLSVAGVYNTGRGTVDF